MYSPGRSTLPRVGRRQLRGQLGPILGEIHMVGGADEVVPSCELGAKQAPMGVQVVRVHLLREVSQSQRGEVRAGFREREGRLEVSRVNTTYLAPVPEGTVLREELFADLRSTARVSVEALPRIAAMTHDARVALLRRDVYFRFRWPLTLDAVAVLVRDRIASDTAFAGPRPTWST